VAPRPEVCAREPHDGGDLRRSGARDRLHPEKSSAAPPASASPGGDTLAIGAMVAEAARPNEVVVSSTFTSLAPVSGLQFELRGKASLGAHGEWAVYVVKDR